MPDCGNHIPQSEQLFECTQFIFMDTKTDAVGLDAPQEMDKDGNPVWDKSAMVKDLGKVIFLGVPGEYCRHLTGQKPFK
jgi:hypothetical protein